MEPIYVRLFALHICENHSEVVALPLGRFALCGDSQSRSWLRLSTNRCLVLLKLSEIHRENRSIGILLLDFSSKNVLDLTCLRSCWPLSSSTTSWHCGTRNFAPDEQWKRCKNGPSPSFFYPFLSFSIRFFGQKHASCLFSTAWVGKPVYSNQDRAISWVVPARLQGARLGRPAVGLISAIFVTTMSCSAFFLVGTEKLLYLGNSSSQSSLWQEKDSGILCQASGRRSSVALSGRKSELHS